LQTKPPSKVIDGDHLVGKTRQDAFQGVGNPEPAIPPAIATVQE
jgi:Txe/YoeB family toxin of Txe-Axe toxin-antitoxin module